jgi:RHS repeat-associated protein
LTDNTGAIEDTYGYTSWGDVSTLDSTAFATTPFLFVGRLGYYDDNEGLTQNTTSPLFPLQVGGRFLEPPWGRWASPDPLLRDANWLNAALRDPSPAALLAILNNQYGYVGNNPINATDPSGQIACTAGEAGECVGICMAKAARQGEIYDRVTSCDRQIVGYVYIFCIPFADWEVVCGCGFKRCKCSTKARNWAVGTRCYNLIFTAVGDCAQAKRASWQACVNAGCHKPGRGGDCGHTTCVQLP